MNRILIHKRSLSSIFPSGTNPAYDSALEYFSKVKTQLQNPMELKYSDPKFHLNFQESQVDLRDPIYARMNHKRWRTLVAPKLVNATKKSGIVGDVFPDAIDPSVNLEINFTNTKWLGAYGHAIPANWALYSPSLAITTNDERLRYFTLMMMDIDKPNLESKSYSEWCHWLVCNIPVQFRCEIDGGSSPFLKSHNIPQEGTQEEERRGIGFFPNPPATTPTIPGNVLLDYIPPHPPLSNPRKNHRYLFSLFESKDIGNKMNTTEIESALNSIQEQGSRPEMKSQGRFTLGPTYKWIKQYNMNLVGYGLFSSVWNIYTPEIYKRLEIHEPVYGSIQKTSTKSPETLKKSIQVAAKLLTGKSDITGISDLEFKSLNKGQVLPLENITSSLLPPAQAVVKTFKTPERIPRLTVIGAAGLVKAREDPAMNGEDETNESVVSPRIKKNFKYRYQNR